MLLTNKDSSDPSGGTGGSGSGSGTYTENDDLYDPKTTPSNKKDSILSNVLRNGAMHILGEDEDRAKASNTHYMDKNIECILKDDAYSVAYSENKGYSESGTGSGIYFCFFYCSVYTRCK